mmetsp:Transcript_104827/g.180756  ORF Transcript_104827/g.180756 Transcript_104827/m.180756 type:complete len:296 (+) Transcript_104827:358-1245(+)
MPHPPPFAPCKHRMLWARPLGVRHRNPQPPSHTSHPSQWGAGTKRPAACTATARPSPRSVGPQGVPRSVPSRTRFLVNGLHPGGPAIAVGTPPPRGMPAAAGLAPASIKSPSLCLCRGRLLGLCGAGPGHLHQQVLHGLPVGGLPGEGNAQLEGLAVLRDLRIEPESVQGGHEGGVHLDRHVRVHDGGVGIRVVGVHVAQHRLGKGADRVRGCLHVVLGRDAAGPGEAPDEADGVDGVHAVPEEIPEVDPEGIRVPLLVGRPQLFDLRLGNLCDVPDQSHAAIGSPLKAVDGDRE